MRSGFWYASGFSRPVFTTLNTAVLAPMPSAITSTARTVKPGFLSSERRANFRSMGRRQQVRCQVKSNAYIGLSRVHVRLWDGATGLKVLRRVLVVTRVTHLVGGAVVYLVVLKNEARGWGMPGARRQAAGGTIGVAWVKGGISLANG